MRLFFVDSIHIPLVFMILLEKKRESFFFSTLHAFLERGETYTCFQPFSLACWQTKFSKLRNEKHLVSSMRVTSTRA
jgi:hypothetical protein